MYAPVRRDYNSDGFLVRVWELYRRGIDGPVYALVREERAGWLANACPVCGGDIYYDYKRERGNPPRLAKCARCSRLYDAREARKFAANVNFATYND